MSCSTAVIANGSRIKMALFMALCLFSISIQSALAGPKVSVPESSFNFGKVPQHAKICKTFWIKSTGDDTLRVLTIVPGCGCTQIPMKDSTLAPGDSSSFDIVFSTGSNRGFVTKKPYLTTNAGPDNMYVEFNTEVVPDSEQMRPLRINPYILDVSQFTVEPRRKASSWIVNESDSNYTLKLVDMAGKDFATELPASVKAHDSTQVTVTVNENAITKEFEQSITFEINNEANSRYTLPIQRMYRLPHDSNDNPK